MVHSSQSDSFPNRNPNKNISFHLGQDIVMEIDTQKYFVIYGCYMKNKMREMHDCNIKQLRKYYKIRIVREHKELAQDLFSFPWLKHHSNDSPF